MSALRTYVFSNNRILFQILTRNDNEHHQQRVLSLLVKQCNNDNNQNELAIQSAVKTCGKAEKDEAKSRNDEAKGVPGRRGVTEGDGTM